MTPAVAYPHEAAPFGASAALAASLQDMLPRLETARLVIRPPEIEDFEAYREILMSDRAVHMVDEPMDRRAAWLDFTQCVAGWHLRGYGLWTIVAKYTGIVLGFTLICMEYGDREPELGWFLTEEAEGQGYAFEAAKAALAHGLDTLALPALVSYIDPPNSRSIRLAEKLGAWRDDAAAAELSALINDEVLVYRHAPQPEAQA